MRLSTRNTRHRSPLKYLFAKSKKATSTASKFPINSATCIPIEEPEQLRELWLRLKDLREDQPAGLSAAEARSVIQEAIHWRALWGTPFGDYKDKLIYALRYYGIDPKDYPDLQE